MLGSVKVNKSLGCLRGFIEMERILLAILLLGGVAG